MDEGIHDAPVQGSDEHHTDHVEDEANSVGSSESQGVLQDQDKGVPCGSAEVLTSDGNLDVSILGNELDESLKAVEQIACAEQNDLDCGIVLVGLLNLLSIVFKDNSDELHKCDQE